MAESFNPFPTEPPEDARVMVEALGQPGNRRFRLLARVHDRTHILWMEKQQVQALGMAIEQMLEQLPAPLRRLQESHEHEDVGFDPTTRHQFRVGRLELGFDVGNDRIVISAHDLMDEVEDSIEPRSTSVDLRITRQEAQLLSDEAAALVAAGRPRCTMCGSPMDAEGHVCPEQNGHLPFILDDSGLE